jgi:hypothetical protein
MKFLIDGTGEYNPTHSLIYRRSGCIRINKNLMYIVCNDVYPVYDFKYIDELDNLEYLKIKYGMMFNSLDVLKKFKNTLKYIDMGSTTVNRRHLKGFKKIKYSMFS